MRLKDACVDAGQYGVNVSPEEYRSAGLRMLRTSDLADGGLSPDDAGVFLDGPIPAAHLLKENDLLLSRAGTIGRSYLVPASGAGITFAGFLIRFRPRGGIDPRFLHYCLRSKPTQDQINAEAVTSTIQNFNAERYANLTIPDASEDEQRRIADFLDDRVARIDQINAARRDQASLSADHLRAALGRLMDTLAAQFGLAPLRRFCGGIEQGSSPVGEDRPAADGEDGLLKTSAIQAGRFVEELNKVIDPDVVNERFRVADGDVLVTRGSGSADLVGDAATVRVTGSARLYLSDLTYRVKALSIDPDFTTLAIISPRGRAELGSLVRQGSGPAKARGDDILAIPIPNAPPSQQTEAVRAAEDIRADTEAGVNGLTEAVRLLSEYKQSLITAAVTGEFDVATAGNGIPG